MVTNSNSALLPGWVRQHWRGCRPGHHGSHIFLRRVSLLSADEDPASRLPPGRLLSAPDERGQRAGGQPAEDSPVLAALVHGHPAGHWRDGPHLRGQADDPERLHRRHACPCHHWLCFSLPDGNGWWQLGRSDCLGGSFGQDWSMEHFPDVHPRCHPHLRRPSIPHQPMHLRSFGLPCSSLPRRILCFHCVGEIRINRN